jgi:spore maturation protein CgeB
MKLVIFGLTVSSSWGNGHATLWRGLCRALAARSHQVVFFERDVPYYRSTRDLFELEGGNLVFYEDWDAVSERAARELADADAAMVTSFCPDGERAAELVLEHTRGVRVFYDMDTPVTLASLEQGVRPPYLPAQGLGGFDLVLSFTGGKALDELQSRLGARRVAPLYGHVDPDVHRPTPPDPDLRADLSYIGTYSGDREAAVDELFFGPARALPSRRFVLAGSMYPDDSHWPENVQHRQHLAPNAHPALFCSSRITLNVTRSTMARFGHCPSGRLFEAAACGAALASDWFEGLDCFFAPEREIHVVRTRKDVIELLERSDQELLRSAEAARERTLACHSAAVRAESLERLLWERPS